MVAKRTRQLVIVRRAAAAAPVAPLHPLLLGPLSPAFICARCVPLPPRPARPSVPLSPSLRALTLSCKAVARLFVPCTLITCRVATWCHVAGRIGGLHHHRYPLSLRRAPGALSNMWGRSAGGHQWMWTRASAPLKVAHPSPSTHPLPPIAFHPSPSTHPLPPIAFHPSPSTHPLPPIPFHPSPSTHPLPPIPFHPSPSTHRLPPIAFHPSPSTHPLPPIPFHPSPSTHPLPPIPFHPSPSTHPLPPMPLTPMPLTPMPLTPMPLTPMPLTPMPLTPMPLTPMPLTPMLLTPMSLTPMSLTHVARSDMPPSALLPPLASVIFTLPPTLPIALSIISLSAHPLTPCLRPPACHPACARLPAPLGGRAEQVARMAAADVVGVVREEVGRVGGQVEAVQALQRASAQAGGDRGAALEARAREAEERAAQLNDTVGRLQAALRQHSATIAALQVGSTAPPSLPCRWAAQRHHRCPAGGQHSATTLAAEQAAGAAGKEGGRPLGRTVVEEDHPGRWRQHTFHRTGAYGFIQYSAYRMSAARIAVVGMGVLGLRSKRRVEGCWWHRLDGHTVIAGKLTQMVMEEHHNYLYELVVLQCALEEEVAETGGHLRIFLDRQVLFPFREDTKEKIDNGTGPMPYHFAYCGPPMHAEMEQRSVQQFIAYHRYAAGYDHLQLYDATAVTPALTAALQPLMDDGLLTIADFRQAYQFDSWYFSQAVAMHDCMYGMRQRADWIAFHDLDEYLALPPPASVPALLQRYAALPYMTLGMYVFSAHLCEEGPADVWSDEEKRFAVERMVQRRSVPYCLRAEDDPKLCIDYYGHRKMFLNPRKVEAVYVHLVDKPATGGVDLSVDDMYFAHLRSLNGKGLACRPPTDKENDLPPAELEKCTTVADTAARARECAQEGFSNQFLCKPRATR
ncbi:unnamed protein product [Closterium sp. NIES-64]|nr:unnamed protein product [Closterium sp. NIES-64]